MRGGAAHFEGEGRWSDGRIYAAIKGWRASESELVHRRSQHSLVLTLTGGTSLTGNKISGSPGYEGIDRPGSLSFVPAGAERRGWYRHANMRFIALLIEPSLVAALGIDGGELPAFTNGHDRLLQSVLCELGNQMVAGAGAVPTVYVEHGAGLAMAHLLQRSRRARAPEPRRARKLSTRELARALDCIESRLDGDVSLSELGAAAGLRPDVFARGFKARTGVPPYRYVMGRRMERAREMLGAKRTSIAEVAFALGFSSQSHFTRAFARHVGITPAAWRRRL